ncbi:MAG: polyprenyl synthetase family protein [Clostridia bacterium]|nr:polyprenyl synthetase family protein [Clostridia bacterium]
MKEELKAYLRETDLAIRARLREDPPFAYGAAELAEGTWSYFERGGKRLRPALCRLSAGALGGAAAEAAAVPCALALELYHNWTLIHDDVIDHDDFRRGKPAVHRLTADRFAAAGADRAAEYGLDVALMAGDALHSAAVAALAGTDGVDPAVVLAILRDLEGRFGPRLIEGETVDTRFGVLYGAGRFPEIRRDEVLNMIAGKTGALFAIAARSGAMIGQNGTAETEETAALSAFAEACGMAFQLQDDVLGLTSTDEVLGKPVYSDIREGKPTLLLLTSYENADEEERAFLLSVVGQKAGEADVAKAASILKARGGVEACLELAGSYLRTAKESLSVLPASRYRDLLLAVMESMVDRKF